MRVKSAVQDATVQERPTRAKGAPDGLPGKLDDTRLDQLKNREEAEPQKSERILTPKEREEAKMAIVEALTPYFDDLSGKDSKWDRRIDFKKKLPVFQYHLFEEAMYAFVKLKPKTLEELKPVFKETIATLPDDMAAYFIYYSYVMAQKFGDNFERYKDAAEVVKEKYAEKDPSLMGDQGQVGNGLSKIYDALA